MDIVDNHRPRFGTVRWWLVRRLLAALNLVEGRFARVREWALEEAVASSPDFATFETWVVEHYAARGRKVVVEKMVAVVPPVVPVRPTHVVNGTHLH